MTDAAAPTRTASTVAVPKLCQKWKEVMQKGLSD
jgi:hypothetical protein